MKKVDRESLERMEAEHPGFLETLAFFESLDLPPCEHCGSTDTAAVQAGVIGQTIKLAAATSKFRLTANGSSEGSLWCHDCGRYFGPSGPCDLSAYRRKPG